MTNNSNQHRQKTIGIIGGGASGAISAIHCWQQMGANAKIHIFDPTLNLGLGKAYSVRDTAYLLNVPAEKMSVYPDQPNHFIEWVKQHDPFIEDSQHWPFVPRIYFGKYLQEQLQKVPLRHIQAKVHSVLRIGSKYHLHLSDGASEQVDYLLIATGYESELSYKWPIQLSELRNRVIQPSDVDQLIGQMRGRILIIGSGLTAIDLWRRLHNSLENNSDSRVICLSRHGLLPESYEFNHSYSGSNCRPVVQIPYLIEMSPLQVFQVLRSIQRVSGISWGYIADRVRLQSERIWSCWTEREQRQFLRHLKHYWEVIRHRVPATVHWEMKEEMSKGRFQIVAGRVKRIQDEERQIRVCYRERTSGSEQDVFCDWVILATGSQMNQDLLQTYRIPGVRACSHGLGYLNDSAARLWVVGPASKAIFWEITSVPEICDQALGIARAIDHDCSYMRSLKALRLWAHPHSVGESYGRHFYNAITFGSSLFKLSLYALLHAIIPFLRIDDTSSGIRNMYPVLSKRRLKMSK